MRFFVQFVIVIVVGLLSTKCFSHVEPYYIKIQYPSAPDYLINLAEVVASYGGTRIVPNDCILSSTYESYAAGYCCDNDFSNFCHSAADANAYFYAKFYYPFDSIVVYNRVNNIARIAGATITVYDSLNVQIYTGTLSGSAATYSFSGFTIEVPTAAPTPNPTALPTTTPSAGPTTPPSAVPSIEPTTAPTASPTRVPTATPTSLWWTATHPAPYTIVIQGPSPSEPYLNLREVYFSLDGTRVVPSTCVLSSVYVETIGSYPGSLCCDGSLDDYCHSTSDTSASLTVTVPSQFDTLIVYNRADYGSWRIVGATITISDANSATIYASTFSADSSTYTFDFSSIPTHSPTPMPTSVPTVSPTVSKSPTVSPTASPTLFLSWAAQHAAPYTIKIQGPNPSQPFLNLMEVYPTLNGNWVTPSDCQLSSVWVETYGTYNGSYCCDGDIINTFCHSQSDTTAFLTVTVPSVFDTLTVYNRMDEPTRIVGASLTLTDADGETIYVSSFTSSENAYTFDFSTDPPTVAPTPNPSEVPSADPTAIPSHMPSYAPTTSPVLTSIPSASPTNPVLSSIPSASPTRLPTARAGKIGISYGKGEPLTRSHMNCFEENHAEFFIPKGFVTKLLPTGDVSSNVDPNICHHLRLSNSTMMPIRGMIVQSVPAYGLRPSTPCMELLKTIRLDCPYFANPTVYGDMKVWIAVTENILPRFGWFANYELNRRWFEKLVTSCKYYFGLRRCGIYATETAWQTVFNDISYHNSSIFSGLSLWYSSLSTDTSSSLMNTNFKNYISGSSHIGQFDQPSMRQFARVSLCGSSVGVNWIR